jgi:hypothetical protein
LTKRILIAVAFTLTVLATAACGGEGVTVKATATTSQATPATSSPTSNPTLTIDPKARPAVDAYLNFVAARAEALRSPRKLGENYAAKADFTKFSFDPDRGQANASIVSLGEQGLLFKGDPGRPRVKVAAIEPDAKPYPTVVLKDCPTPTPTWRIYDAKTGKDVTLPLPTGTQPTPTCRRWKSFITKVVGAYRRLSLTRAGHAPSRLAWAGGPRCRCGYLGGRPVSDRSDRG